MNAVYYKREVAGVEVLYRLTKAEGHLWARDAKEWITREGLRSEIVHRATGMGGDCDQDEITKDEAMKITGGVE